jgi:hypothetical protein
MNTTYRSVTLGGAALAAAVALASCGGGGSGSATLQTGSMSLAITDAAIAGLPDGAKVIITVTGVELKPQQSEAVQIDFDPPKVIDLLSLSGNASELLFQDEEVPADSYNWVRLKVLAGRGQFDSFVDMTGDGLTGDDVSLFIPSGNQSGLKLVAASDKIVVEPDGEVDFTIDWDVRKSVFINDPQGFGDYVLRPVIRIVNDLEVGSISGTVTTELVDGLSDQEGATCAVYAFPGPLSPLDDVDQGVEGTDEADGPEPITSANLEPVLVDEVVTAWSYTLGFLEAGAYTLGLTCDAELDLPGEDNDGEVVFGDQAEAEVTAGADTVVDFPSGG